MRQNLQQDLSLHTNTASVGSSHNYMVSVVLSAAIEGN